MKKIAASLALSTLAVTGVEAQEPRRDRIAPPAVYDVAPGLGGFTDQVLFGEVWPNEDLAQRDRSLITVSALISTGKIAQVASHTRRALDNGVSPAEIGEVITQLAFYSGWPNAISAVFEVKKVFDEREIGPVTVSDAARLELEAAAEAARTAAVDTHVAPTAPALAELTNRVLFGDLWRRPELAPRDRSLVTMAALIAIGQPEQLPFHANRAMDNGLTRDEAAAVPTHLGFYAGWPRAMSAVPVLAKVFGDRAGAANVGGAPDETELRVVRSSVDEGFKGSSENFTGDVRVYGLFRAEEPARVGGGTVSFAPGARTAWHTHPLGQTLHIVAGRGWVQQEGGPVLEVHPGDVVWIPPLTRHWHGAAEDQPMTHLAISEAQDGSSVTWMELVPDDVYLAGRRPGGT